MSGETWGMATQKPKDSPKEQGRAEHRWPAVASVVVALVLYVLLPSSFLPPLR